MGFDFSPASIVFVSTSGGYLWLIKCESTMNGHFPSITCSHAVHTRWETLHRYLFLTGARRSARGCSPFWASVAVTLAEPVYYTYFKPDKKLWRGWKPFHTAHRSSEQLKRLPFVSLCWSLRMMEGSLEVNVSGASVAQGVRENKNDSDSVGWYCKLMYRCFFIISAWVYNLAGLALLSPGGKITPPHPPSLHAQRWAEE